jgi:conjugal transfer pilus assembly protein TraL
MDRYIIPGTLDEPERIGLWTVDEFAVMAGPFVVGIFVQQILFGIGLGLLGWLVLRKAKAGQAAAFLLHLAYWHLPPGMTGIRAVPPSHLRLLAG